jgi:hypothetical protein
MYSHLRDSTLELDAVVPPGRGRSIAACKRVPAPSPPAVPSSCLDPSAGERAGVRGGFAERPGTQVTLWTGNIGNTRCVVRSRGNPGLEEEPGLREVGRDPPAGFSEGEGSNAIAVCGGAHVHSVSRSQGGRRRPRAPGASGWFRSGRIVASDTYTCAWRPQSTRPVRCKARCRVRWA